MKFLRSLVFICSVGPLLGASEGGEAGGHGETTSSEERKSFKVTPCAISHAKLNVVLRELVDESLEIYVNCLSFDRKASLVNGVVSGVNMSANPSSPGIRLVLSCVEDVIAARPSLEAPILQKMNSTACLSCVDQPTNVCMDACTSPCERCFYTQVTCSRCLACTGEPEDCYLSGEGMTGLTHCDQTCPDTLEVEPERLNECDCPSGYHRELIGPYLAAPRIPHEEEEGVIEECESPELEPFKCVSDCTINGHEPNEELNFCFSCGLEYCVNCSSAAGECFDCLEHTQLFEHECFSCPLASVAAEAIIQEEELEEEENAQRLRQLELAIILPILCVLVIIFFLGMSVFAHNHYPHINPKGHKRHRTKPEDLNETEGQPANVWRPRPTVRLR